MPILPTPPLPSRRARALAADGPFAIPATIEQLLLVASIFWVLTANRPFLAAIVGERPLTAAGTWGLLLATAVLLVAIHFALLALLATRLTVKPLLALMIVTTVIASHFVSAYGILLDPTMLRNVLRTDFLEARELLLPALAVELALYALLPLLLLWRARITVRPPLRACGARLLALLLAAVAMAGSLALVYKPLSSLMRNHKELRHLITPANYLWSLASAAASDARGVARPRAPIGLDAVAGPGGEKGDRPRFVVVVVGETARAANWGLNGYLRQTTPELARLDVINFSQVASCGTNTDVSLPCMFAPVGRRSYDAERINDSESLLHVLARAGVAVQWRDNQSGCKGVCDGVPSESVATMNPPGFCAGGRCLDGGLLQGLDERLRRARGSNLIVLHQLGNHGPSYFRRYPPAFARCQPECTNDDLSKCSSEQIVNAYDNALLYTDHVLASLITILQARAGEVDEADWDLLRGCRSPELAAG